MTTKAIRLLDRNPPGTETHRAGWPYAVRSLAPLVSDDGILFDDFVEWDLLYWKHARAHTEPWVGVFHHAPLLGKILQSRLSHGEMFSRPEWQASVPHLKLAFTLTEYLAEFLRPRLPAPVVTVRHPAVAPDVRFSEEAFVSNPDRKLVQIGWPGRNVLAIQQLPAIEGFQNAALALQRGGLSQYYFRLMHRLRKRQQRPKLNRILTIPRLNNEEYDTLLARNAVFLEMLDCSYSTTVLECIMRNTPLVVNRHPALEEYLGTKYPLFYERFEDAPDLVTVDRLLEGHRYLRDMDKSPYAPERFVAAIAEAVGHVL